MTKGIQSIEHGFLLLDALLEAGEPMPMGRLAARAKMTTSKARAYLISLMRTGLVTQVGEAGPYELGPSAIRLGMEALRRVDAMQTARRVMAELDQATRLPAVLTMWNGSDATIIAQNEQLRDFPVDFRVGRTLSALTRTAAGRVFIAYLPEAWTASQVQRELADNPTHDDTRHITARYLAEQIEIVKKEGIATVDGFRVSSGIFLDGYSALAVPVIDQIQRRCFAVSLIFERNSDAGQRAAYLSAARQAISRTVPAVPLTDY
ncbi:transcriptional regulator, IclR family [Burkholderia sp. D7]|jgi:DNA-binding IclR family transcriptional regulator|nr:transcriptional regulator, IclR family [Burkholderia sp. D7]